MKKKLVSRLIVLIMAIMLVLSLCVPAHADQLADIKARGYIIIATEGDWQPWTYHNEANELVGLDIEIGKAIAEYLGVEARFEETNWDAILAGVDSGRFDLACNGVGYTETRAEKYDFSVPYVYTHKVLVVRSDNDKVTSLEDLNGKKTANTASSTYAALAESYGAEVVGVETLAETFALLLQGRVDATINSEVTINDYLLAHPEAPLKIVDETEGDPVAIPLRKGEDSASLRQAVNEVLEALRSSGRLTEISVKYFNGLDLSVVPAAE